jgi:VanZ family protein
MKKGAFPLIFVLLLLTYFLSSIPGLGVLPVFRQVNAFLKSIDISVSHLVYRIIDRLPEQLGPARTLTEDFLVYARANPVILEFLLRKTAHVVLFFFITLALFLFIQQYFRNPWLAAVLSFLAATLVAVLDEYHQSFVPGRSGNVVDVAIDMVGVTAAIMLILFALSLARRYRY